MDEQAAAANTDANVVPLPRKAHLSGRPSLLLSSGPAAGQRFELDPGTVVIGRIPAAQVRLDGPGISRQHAEAVVSGSQVMLRDLGSANGTQVNGQRVVAAITLRDGDLIRVGSAVLRYHAAGA
jgi:pSer/pThr/pTyr-binding forkhead associated (FHA) protein